MHACCRFATLHPIEDKNHPLPPHLSKVVDVLDAASGASATHIIGRLQGAGRDMALHADTAGRAYTCNLVWRQATDGTGGSVDFVHTSQPNIVYRIVFTQPSLYIMSDVGGGIMVEPAAHHWAHGVSTHELKAGHMLCALVTEYRAPVSFTAVVKHLSEQWASSSSCHQLSPVMLDKISAVPGQWPPSSKSITSKMLGRFGCVYDIIYVYMALSMRTSHCTCVDFMLVHCGFAVQASLVVRHQQHHHLDRP